MTSPDVVFNSLEKATLISIVRRERLMHASEDFDKVKKSALVKKLVAACEEIAIKQVLSQFDKDTLDAICAPLKIDHENNLPTKVVLKKRIGEKMNELGSEDFMNKYMTEDLVKHFIVACDEKPKGDKEALINQAVELINYIGIQAFLGHFEVDRLKDMMSTMKLKCSTDSKSKILHAIATQTSARGEKRDVEEIKFSKKKLPLKKGITYQDIFQHYNLEELVDWCRENDMKVSGTKKEVIERILDFLDGNKENTPAKSNQAEKPKEKKSEEGSKSPKKTKKPAPKKEEKEEKEESASEEETESAPPKSPSKSKESKENKKSESSDNEMEVEKNKKKNTKK